MRRSAGLGGCARRDRSLLEDRYTESVILRPSRSGLPVGSNRIESERKVNKSKIHSLDCKRISSEKRNMQNRYYLYLAKCSNFKLSILSNQYIITLVEHCVTSGS